MTDKTAIKKELAERMHGDREYAETFFIAGISNWASDTIRNHARGYFPEEGFDGVTEGELIDTLAAQYADSAASDPDDAEKLVDRVTENWLDETWENYAGLAPAPAPAGTTL